MSPSHWYAFWLGMHLSMLITSLLLTPIVGGVLLLAASISAVMVFMNWLALKATA